MISRPKIRSPNVRGGPAPQPEEPYPSFLGSGWSFPPTFSPFKASVEMSIGDADIRESLGILLSTRLEERIMLASYGCDLWSQVFTTLTPTTANAIANMVTNAIIEWEPRIDAENVTVTETRNGTGWLNINIDYRIIQTNQRSNLVFPFYTREATLTAPAG